MTPAAQIRADLERQVHALGGALGVDVIGLLLPRCSARADMLAAELDSGDDSLAAETVVTLADVGVIPDPVPEEWWATPLGRAVARSVGHPTADAVSLSVAGAMLGVSKQGAADLVHRGKLDRHPDGGVLVASIRQRLADRLGP